MSQCFLNCIAGHATCRQFTLGIEAPAVMPFKSAFQVFAYLAGLGFCFEWDEVKSTAGRFLRMSGAGPVLRENLSLFRRQGL